MSFELHLSIEEDSPEARTIQLVAKTEHISNEQAAGRLLAEAVKYRSDKTPAEGMLGAFSSEEDVALMGEVMEIVHARRAADSSWDLDS
ncbi:MAG TPA: hypothetical protein VG944_04210 [Fimbriimonas sp.]|nr:hypothetical protein [Fimbriimonas sp.]